MSRDIAEVSEGDLDTAEWAVPTEQPRRGSLVLAAGTHLGTGRTGSACPTAIPLGDGRLPRLAGQDGFRFYVDGAGPDRATRVRWGQCMLGCRKMPGTRW